MAHGTTQLACLCVEQLHSHVLVADVPHHDIVDPLPQVAQIAIRQYMPQAQVALLDKLGVLLVAVGVARHDRLSPVSIACVSQTGQSPVSRLGGRRP